MDTQIEAPPLGGIRPAHHLQRLRSALDAPANGGASVEQIARELYVDPDRVTAWIDGHEPVPEWAIALARRVHKTGEPQPWAVSQYEDICDVRVELVAPYPRRDTPDQYGVTYDGVLIADGLVWGAGAELMLTLAREADARKAAVAWIDSDRAERDRHGRR